MALEDFVMKGTLSFFEHLQLPVGFLDIDVALWNDNPEYSMALILLNTCVLSMTRLKEQYHSSRTTMPS